MRRSEEGKEWRRLLEGGQGPKGTVAPYMEWRGYSVKFAGHI
jgi:hypothetical protein